MSLPSRERGLKLEEPNETRIIVKVAPLAGAWIEISYTTATAGSNLSLPSRERGLKLI